MYFPLSGVEVNPFLPPIFAFVISFFCSTAGVTGAFLLLPYQISVLGFSGPAASATNLLYNIISSPGGVIKYWRNNQLLMPLVTVLLAGTLPGMIIGIFIRIHLLPDPTYFKLFVGAVLLFLSVQLLIRTWISTQPDKKSPLAGEFNVHIESFNLRQLEIRFNDELHSISVPFVGLASLIIGIVSGAYGIGGGSLSASFLVGVCGLPLYLTAGATILTTFLASVIGVFGFTLVSPIYSQSGLATSPDWLLGLFFGVGGLAGMYSGATVQRFIPAKAIRTLLGILLLGIALKYIIGFYHYLVG